MVAAGEAATVGAGASRGAFEAFVGPACGSAWKRDPVSGVIGVE